MDCGAKENPMRDAFVESHPFAKNAIKIGHPAGEGTVDKDVIATTNYNRIELWAPFARKDSAEITGLFIGEGFHLSSNGGAGDDALSMLPAVQGHKGGRYNKFDGTVHSACDSKL